MLYSLRSFFQRRPIAVDLAVFVAGCLYPLAFSPFGLWPFAVGALAVLALATRNAGVGRGSWRFYIFSVGLYGVGVSWFYVSIHEHGGASAVLAGALVLGFVLSISLLTLVYGWLYMRFVRPAPLGLLLGFPLMWLLREWTTTWLFTGFPWLLAGYSPIDTWLAGYAPLLGVLGVGLIVTLQASFIAWALVRPNQRRLAACAGVLVLIWGAGWASSKIRFVTPTGQYITVSLVQGDIDQDLKWRPEMVGPIIDKYLALTRTQWGSDLIVWPEASITLFRRQAASLLQELGELGKRTGTTLILGLPQRSPDGHFLNTAIAVGDGHGTYIKRHLVPFGEYMPFAKVLRGLINFFDLPMSYNEPGPAEQAPLHAGNLILSLSICYEVVFPELVRNTVKNPDLFITISNDSWFGHSIGPWQHFQMARMRALENGRYMVRDTNNGVTGIIDEHGKVVAELPRFEAGVLRGEVAEFTGRTPWSRFGERPLLGITAFFLILMLLARLLRRV